MHVVGDIGRALAHPPDSTELHEVLTALAVLREELEEDYHDKVERSPWRALAQQDNLSVPYAAGALWACSTAVNAVLSAHEDVRRWGDRRSARDGARRIARQLAKERGVITPHDVAEMLHQYGREVDRSTVSKAIGDLLTSGVLESTDPPLDGKDDRRRRYYRYRPGADPTAEAQPTVQQFVSTMLATVDGDEIPGLVHAELATRGALSSQA